MSSAHFKVLEDRDHVLFISAVVEPGIISYFKMMFNICELKIKMKQEVIPHHVLLECYSLFETDMLNEHASEKCLYASEKYYSECTVYNFAQHCMACGSSNTRLFQTFKIIPGNIKKMINF